MSEAGYLEQDIKYYPLTNAQQGILMEQLRYPDDMHYNLPCKVILPLSADADRLGRCFETVIGSHDTWKVSFGYRDGELCQYVDPAKKFKCVRKFIKESEVDEFQEKFLRPFKPLSDILIRLQIVTTELRHIVFWDIFHAVGDGVTVNNIYREVNDLYGGIPPEPFIDDLIFKAALEQKEYRSSTDHEIDKEYFRNLLSGNPSYIISPPPAYPIGKGLETVKFIPHGQILDFCKEKRVKEAYLMYAAYALTLSSLTRSDSVSFLTPIHGRDKRNLKAHGTFISTNPFICRIDRGMTSSAFISYAGELLFSIMRHRRYDYLEIVNDTGIGIDTFFAWQGTMVQSLFLLDGKTYPAEQIRSGHMTSAPLSVAIYEYDDNLEVHVECSSARYDERFLTAVANAFTACLTGLIEHFDDCVGMVPPVSAPELERLKAGGHTPGLPAPDFADIIDAFDSIRRSYPEKTAVISDCSRLTFGELAERSERIAAGILAAGCGKRRPVILLADREADTVAAMIGALKAGVPYIPVDTSSPKERIDYIYADSGAGLILDNDIIKKHIGSSGGPVPRRSAPKDIAYMIYTSGSTGRPKGVEISRKALWTFVRGISKVLGINSDDRISCHSSFAFDASVEDIFPVLCCGGTLLIVPERLRRDVHILGEWLEANSVTGGNYTTAFGEILMESCDLHSLRYIVLGGEKMDRWPMRNRGICTYNTYGPTEFTVDATWFKLDPDADYANIPIGRPLPGLTVMLMDHCGNPVPFGAKGEICLLGDQKASGYHNAGRLSEFGDYYRTGDIGYWDENWNLCFVTRDDSQCKLNGYRIELSEIDSCLLSIPGISKSKSIINPSRRMICSYYVSESGLDDGVISSFLKNRLPSYMMPSCYVRLEEMPLNTSGKIDVHGLPDPPAGKGLLNDSPVGEREQVALDCAREVLSRNDFGVTDDLLLLGMSSIQMMEYALKLSNNGIEDVTVSDIYDHPRIREFLSASYEDPEPAWYNDNNLPVMVFFSGITPFRQIESVLKSFSASYHICLIPRIRDAFCRMPEEMEIDGLQWPAVICGHSFGGEMAYRYAVKLQEHGGNPLPELILFDTFVNPMNVGADLSSLGIAGESARLYHKFHESDKLQGYGGHIRLYSAKRTAGKDANIKAWRMLHPDIEIIETEADHDNVLAIVGSLDIIQK